MPTRNSQSSNKSKLFGRRSELLGAGKVFSRRVKRGISRKDGSKGRPSSSKRSQELNQ